MMPVWLFKIEMWDRRVPTQHPESHVESPTFGHLHPVCEPARRMSVQGAAVDLAVGLRTHPHGRIPVRRLRRDDANREEVDAGWFPGKKPYGELLPRLLPISRPGVLTTTGEEPVGAECIGVYGAVADHG